MFLRQLFDYDTYTFTYLIADEKSKEAIIIDSVNSQVTRDHNLIRELGFTLKYALDTHVHADHITGAGSLRELTRCETGVAACAHVECANVGLNDGDRLTFGQYTLKVLATPGHTRGCLSFYVDNCVFTGDALFIRGTGRTDFQEGNAGTLYDSITQQLYTLPNETLVYPGHDYRGFNVSTIEEEKAHNPRTKLMREAFINHMDNLHLPNPSQIDQALPANQTCGRLVN